MNTITEQNKLIVEFMGYDKDVYFPNIRYLIPKISEVENAVIWKQDYDMKFHSSWNWLMPVVEKIEDTTINKETFNVIIEQCFCNIINNHTSEDIVEVDADSKINAVYKAVVQFILWYNQLKK